MRANRIYISIIIVLFSIGNIFSQLTIRKDSTFQYKVSKKNELIINNNRGNINILNSKNDTVYIEVKISAKAQNEKKVIKLIKKVTFKNEINGNLISVSTKLDKFKKSDNLHIDYIVRVPMYTNLYLSNQNGNIYIKDHGKTNITLKYGKLEAKNLISNETKPLPKLNFEFSDIDIDNCNWAEITCNHTNINIKKSKNLIFNSNFSIIKIDNSTILNLNSYKDIYKINTVSQLNAKTKNTSVYAQSVSSKIKLTGSFGYFKTGHISSFFDNINVNFKNGDVSLLIDKSASYKLNCSAADGNIKIDNKDNLNKIEGSNFSGIEDIIGSDKDTKKQVNVKITNGNIVF